MLKNRYPDFRKKILICAGVFVMGIVLGMLAAALFHADRMPAAHVENVMAVGVEPSRGLSIYHLFSNNIRVAFLSFAAGIVTFGIYSFFSTTFNGFLLGFAWIDVFRAGVNPNQILNLSYHVPFEVSAICLFAALGLTGDYFFDDETDAKKKKVFYILNMAIGTSLISIAALIESHLSK